ncbi:hypothetical protein PMAYCL1PPCAC_05975, partial [Pristionchus mayeri]
LPFFILTLSILHELKCHPPAFSTDRERLKNSGLSCFFAVERYSISNTRKRIDSTAVSTTCTGSSKKLGTLLGPTRMELYGTSSKMDLAMTRGMAFYSKNEEELRQFADLDICEHHEKELLTQWSTKHIKVKTIGETHHQKCSFPIITGEPHDAFAEKEDSHTHNVQKEEARLFTEATGHHIHVGTPICADHHKMITGIIEDYKSGDMDW